MYDYHYLWISTCNSFEYFTQIYIRCMQLKTHSLKYMSTASGYPITFVSQAIFYLSISWVQLSIWAANRAITTN